MGLARKIARLGRRLWGGGQGPHFESRVDQWRACRVEELEPRQLMTASSLAGQVYQDQMGPGAYLPGDTLVGGATVQLLDQNNNLVASATTSAGGQYQFQNVTAGVYSLHLVEPSGSLQGNAFAGSLGGSVADPNDLANITVGSAQNGTGYNFYVVQPNIISGAVKIETTSDWATNPADPPLAGVTVDLLDSQGTVLAATQTDANGDYSFTNLYTGTYSLQAVVPKGYLAGHDQVGNQGGTANGGSEIDGVFVMCGNTGVNYDFSVVPPNSIGGTVQLEPAPGDETNPANTPVANVTVDLLDGQGHVLATTTTNSSGQYTFQNLQPGTYEVREIVPTNYTAGNDLVGSVGGTANGLAEIDGAALADGAQAVNYNFFLVQPSSLAGIAYIDQYNTGVYQSGDTLLSNVPIQLLDQNQNVIASTVTGASGQYQFAGLLPGVYSIRQTQPPGYLTGGANIGSLGGLAPDADDLTQVSVAPNQNGVNYNFYVVQPDSISGYVKIETTSDWDTNPADPPLAGVTMSLLNSQGTVIATTQTDENGQYTFNNLYPGTYSVKETVPSPYFASDDQLGSQGGVLNGLTEIDNIVLVCDANGTHYDFAVVPPDSISGDVKWDEFGPCNLFPNDPGLAGVTIQLLNSTGTVINTTTTDANGDYSFKNLYPGSYSVREIVPTGWFAGLDEVGSAGGVTNGQTELDNANLVGGINAVNYNFCVAPPDSIAGVVKVETTPDWETNSSDPVLPGVTVQLLDSTGTVVATQQTDSNGAYDFTELMPGTYSVREIVPANYFASDDHVGSLGGTANGLTELDSIVLVGGVNGVHYDFAVVPPDSISGDVKWDEFGPCNLFPNDPGLAGVTIQLLNSTGAVINTTTTDANGDYSFKNLYPGSYSVREIVPTGWFAGLDEVGSAGGVTNGQTELDNANLVGGINAVNYNFCVAPPDSIAGVVKVETTPDWETNSSDPVLPGVTIQLLNAAGTVVATQQTGENGAYDFTELMPATYSVRELVPNGYFASDDHVGSLGGTANGLTELDSIVLVGGVNGVHYDFAVVPPDSISGDVKWDEFGPCNLFPNDPGLAGVTIQLLNATGTVINTTTTDANGDYSFKNLYPGSYSVREIVPTGWFAGLDEVGSAGGVTNGQTELDNANLVGGINAVNYNFCVAPPDSIAGVVKVETTPDWETNSSDPVLPGVTVQLLNAAGTVVATQQTGENGAYDFTELMPATYSVRELVPDGYFASDDHVGSLGGTANGLTELDSIVLVGGVNGVHYDFAVEQPNSISGVVKEETTSDWETNPADPTIAGVTIQLFNASNTLVATTQTNSNGQYSFTNLLPGTYSVLETVPSNYFASDDHVGSLGGTADGLTGLDSISVANGVNGVHYDFALVPPDSVSGHVKLAVYGDCATHPNDPGLAGVTIQLINSAGQVAATTQTDQNGNYAFSGLYPGVYSLHEVVPGDDIPDDDMVGTAGGVTNGFTQLNSINLTGGVNATDYYFCLSQPSTISGNVFQDGPTIQQLPGVTTPVTAANSGRTGIYQPGDALIPGVTLILADASGNILTGANGQPIETTTDANGHYAFTGLLQGTYTVYELPPSGYIVGLETAGSTGGVALNPGVAAPAGFVGNSATAIASITVANNQTSINNNFSVLLVAQPFLFVPPNPANPALANPTVTNPFAPPTPFLQQTIAPAGPVVSYYSGGAGDSFTWHLSVVNAGQPRGDQLVQLTAQQRDLTGDWETDRLTESEWILAGEDTQQPPRQFNFGMRNGTPVTGDFNGDGITDVGVFKDGQWFIDLNGNGVWDKQDLWAKLGYRDDLPITGDWDGDGKADIGIYGKAWGGDARAIANEPGLPDPDNKNAGVRKNVAKRETAPHGWRTMQRTSTGRMRNDLIDHVFHYGTPGDQPIAGDWNGAGVDTIGIFRDGRWDLDVDGDGKWSAGDKSFQMGQHGDIPVAGDFDGDGRDDLGVYRAGTWHIDVNADRVLDDRDVVVHLGQAGDVPVVGDWNGDGREEMGVYRNGRLVAVPKAAMNPADAPK